MRRPKPKVRMGRPPKSPDQKQKACIMVRVTKAEYAEIEKEAKRAKLSLSALMMTAWRERKRKE